jgi:hypothetical protein
MVLMVGALTVLALTVAVTIDGGNAFAQQRATQNGSDAASLAGAVELGNYGSCVLNGCTGPTSASVRAAIDAAAAANSVTVSAAYFTDVCGHLLRTDGEAAASVADAARVGTDPIPPNAGNTANCATTSGESAGPPAGVLVFGHRDSPTYIATIIGINSFAIDTQATAVSTYGSCGASQGCGLLPVAFPVFQTTCDNNGDAVAIQPLTPYLLDVVYKIPLCKNNAGNVGWIDWSPKAGGASEVADAIAAPHNSPISFASWQFVYQPGNVQGSGIESAMRAREGDTVRAVQFDHTCAGADPDSSYPIVNDPNQYYGCPAANYDQSGNSANIWYHLHQMLGFVLCDTSSAECDYLHDAYMGSTGHPTECDVAGNGARTCIIGKFIDLGSSGLGGGSDTAPVQLIK